MAWGFLHEINLTTWLSVRTNFSFRKSMACLGDQIKITRELPRFHDSGFDFKTHINRCLYLKSFLDNGPMIFRVTQLKSEVSERTTVWSKPPPLKIFCEVLRVAEYAKIAGRISAKPPGTIAEYQQIRKHSCIKSPKTTVWTKPSPFAGVQSMLNKDDPEYHILRAHNFKPGFPNVCINQKSKYLKSLQNLKALQYLTFLHYLKFLQYPNSFSTSTPCSTSSSCKT